MLGGYLKALVMYSHGLGDVIQLTPHLRYLYEHGYEIDLMCRPQVRQTKLLDKCPYVKRLIDIYNPWKTKDGLSRNLAKYDEIKHKYDWHGKALHQNITGSKIDFTATELKIPLVNKWLEVFIPKEIEDKAINFVRSNFPGGYIFIHTFPEEHKYHEWDASSFIRNNLPAIPKVYNRIFDQDINFAFVVAREAKYVVLSSSVFVHACDALGKTIDAVNYGRPDRKVWPLNTSKVLRIRENGKWIKS